MTRTLIAELGGKVGERVTIRGWAQAVRDQKRMQFLVVRDESGLAQVVLGKEEPPGELNERVSALTAESAARSRSASGSTTMWFLAPPRACTRLPLRVPLS